MKKQFTFFLILFFASVFFLTTSPVSAGECDYNKGKITSIVPSSSITLGEILTINGYGFGEIKEINIDSSNSKYDRGISVTYNCNGGRCGAGEFWDAPPDSPKIIHSWSDNKIEVKIPERWERSVSSALRQSVNKFNLSIVIKEYKYLTTLSNGRKIYELSDASTICGNPFDSTFFLFNPSCTEDIYSCSNWGQCSIDGQQTKNCTRILDCSWLDTPSPSTTQSCIPECTADSWQCSDWNTCELNGIQTRTCAKKYNCEGGVSSPVASQSCEYFPACTNDSYSCSEWSLCSSNRSQTRDCNKVLNCQGGVSSPAITQSCVYIPACTSFTYSSWSDCSVDGKQTRSVISKYPSNCESGESPKVIQSCTPTPPPVNPGATNRCEQIEKNIKYWLDLDKSSINPERLPFSPSDISQMWEARHKAVVAHLKNLLDLAKNYQCGSETKCTQDTWQCDTWGSCSPQGIQTRSCTRTYDCPSAETAAPATSQYCEAPNQPKQQSPTEDLDIVNQSRIIKSTVKLVCPVSRTTASQGSGTVINSTGLILTNKHVIDGTAGCLIGFIDDYGDEPYFGDRQIADIYKISSDADVAVLKLRNPSNTSLTSVSISQSNSSSIKLGEILTTYGYPAKFGTKITYTSGDFSGVDGNYLKTTAIIEHGNSGGGAYLKNGAFIGIPTAVVKGSLNSLGYLLSVNKVNSWLNNSIAYNYNNDDNNYSRVSALLEDIDLNTLDSLGLFLPGDEKNLKTQTESQKVIVEEKSLITKIDNSLSRRVSGNILLQVEKNGEGWYVYPDNKKKYYLGRPADAFSIMRNLGLGIKHSELANYLNAKFPSRLSGKILLDVEQNGEAYYINPNDLKGYYLSRPADAFRIMRELGLGITNDDIRKIDVGETE